MHLQTSALLQRRRAYKPRTTTGCSTCRIRRIKCDEAEPSCGQCIRGRRTCDGYVKGCRTSHESKSPLSSVAIPRVSILIGTEKERRVFDYFRCHTAPRLSGPFSSPFWDQLLLQATHHQPAIWHAVVALGSLHRHFEQNYLRAHQEEEDFATQQYVRAIAFVLVPIRERGKQAADVALMTCILFTCFEILRGHYNVALAHIDGGVNIISELQSLQSNASLVLSPSPYVPLAMLEQLFSRLDAQASQISNRRPRRLLYQSISETRSGCDISIPSSFCSFEAAHGALEDIRTCAMKAMQSLPPPRPVADPPLSATAEVQISLDLIRDSSAIRLKQWSSAFEELLFQSQKTDVSEIESRHIQILKLHRVMADLHINIDFVRATRDEMMWDEYAEEFETMVGHAETLLKLEQGQKQLAFAFDTEIILPLYFVAAKCRHGRVRRMAISLLRSQQRQEGVWNSHLTARVAEYLMQLEEEGLHGTVVAADVVRRKRVLGVEVTFDLEEKRAIISYVKLKESNGIERLNEWVEWDSLVPKIL